MTKQSIQRRLGNVDLNRRMVTHSLRTLEGRRKEWMEIEVSSIRGKENRKFRRSLSCFNFQCCVKGEFW